ncbi:MAG TPA: PA14 domain-containing protein, partial [Verrucomicrobiae bacterium]|nr:PA14 domain-containing protein [Verrucomicrobiae bacterium]
MKSLFALKSLRRVGRPFWVAMSVMLISLTTARAMIDQNGNGMSDVWEWLYNAYGIDPNQDSDGDKFSNLQEALAGTNPSDSNSFPHITFAAMGSNGFSVTVPCALGKNYQLQSADNPNSTNWIVETNIVARSGTNVTLTAQVSATARFYRVAISDVSSDGVGLTDWEAYQLGLNPTNAFSNGQQDTNGNAMNDYEYALSKLAQQNVITIAATGPTATQPDPGTKATSFGQFTITRGGFPLNALTINLATIPSGPGFGTPGVDFVSLPTAIILPAGTSSETFTLVPMANTNLQAPVLAQWKVLSDPKHLYTLGDPKVASVVVYPSPTAKGTGLLGQYYTNSSSTYTNTLNFNPTNLFLTRTDPVIDFNWTNGTSPNLSNGTYTVRWTGQVQPQFSETYMFDVKSDDGCKLWVNDQLLINKWQSQGLTDWTNSIALQAGTRYDIKLEYLQTGGAAQAHLYWYSPSQSEEIIPNSSLYPSNSYVPSATNAAAAVTSPLTAVAFLGQPFTFTVTGANSPLGFSVTDLPPGLGFNPTNNIISGVPTVAGTFSASLTCSNLAGVGASTLTI